MRPNTNNGNSLRQSFAKLQVATVVACALLIGIGTPTVLLAAGDNSPDRIPSNVAWTPATLGAASSGDPFRGMLLSKQCEHCHGSEGFSPNGPTPNLAGMSAPTVWKQLEDFRAHKRTSRVMEPIAAPLAAPDVADLAAYYSKLPIFSDPQDNRIFPQPLTDGSRSAIAARLIAFGDGERGIPPCQSCHGPVAFRVGVPSLATQNTDYLVNQLEAFARGARSNDINQPMRTIAGLLTKEERRALAEFYGAGLGMQPTGSK